MTSPQAITGAVGGLRFASGLQFDFQPSIGLLAARVEKLGMDLDDFREPLARSIKTVMIPSIQQNFEAEGRPSWPPLAEYTIQRRGGDSGHILNVTGALEADATSFDIWHITDTAASIQSWPGRTWYAQIHQAGLRGKKIYIPARPFIMFQSEDEDDIKLVFMEWLEENLAKDWGRA